MDGAGFMGPGAWDKLLQSTGYTTIELRDARYDAVVHMVTAADGCPEFYDYGNTARYHTPEMAVEADKALRAVYLGHNKVFVIGNDNKDGFEGKLQDTVESVKSVLGLPTQKTRHYKFLVDNTMIDKSLFDPDSTVGDVDPQELHTAMLRDNQIEPHNDSDCECSPVTPLGLSKQSSSNNSEEMDSSNSDETAKKI